MITASRLRQLALARTPQYFAILHTIPLSVDKLGLPTHLLGEHIYLVQLDEADLPNPECDPIAICGDGKGNRRYLWRNEYWGDYQVHTMPLLDDLVARNLHSNPTELQDAIQFIRHQRTAGAMPQPATWRALYRLPDLEQGD